MDFIFMRRGVTLHSLNWSGWHIFQKPNHDLPFRPSWQCKIAIFCQVSGEQPLLLVHWTLRVVFFESRWNPQHARIWCGTCWWLAHQTLSWVGSNHLWTSESWPYNHLWENNHSMPLWLLGVLMSTPSPEKDSLLGPTVQEKIGDRILKMEGFFWFTLY